MACSSDGYPPSEREMWERAAFPAACELSRFLTKAQRKKLSKNTTKWLEEHERFDAEKKREQAEEYSRLKRRREALGKLSKDEKEALGIR